MHKYKKKQDLVVLFPCVAEGESRFINRLTVSVRSCLKKILGRKVFLPFFKGFILYFVIIDNYELQGVSIVYICRAATSCLARV